MDLAFHGAARRQNHEHLGGLLLCSQTQRAAHHQPPQQEQPPSAQHCVLPMADQTKFVSSTFSSLLWATRTLQETHKQMRWPRTCSCHCSPCCFPVTLMSKSRTDYLVCHAFVYIHLLASENLQLQPPGVALIFSRSAFQRFRGDI